MALAGISIPNDVTNHLLSASPDFSTLHSAIGVCKTWHRIFKAHPKAVMRSVAFNLAGPALPQAVQLLRYPYEEKRSEWSDPDGDENDADEEEDEDPAEDDTLPVKLTTAKSLAASSESADIGDLSLEEKAQLQKNAKIVQNLEGIFRLRHMDRSRQLTALESHHFRRAMYRVMLYCKLFYLPLNLEDIASMEDVPDELDQMIEARHSMLNEYSTPELLEIRAVVAFLHELIREILDQGDYDRLKDISLSTGPEVILEAYLSKQRASFEAALEPGVMTGGGQTSLFPGFFEDNSFFGGWFSAPLDRICKERTVVPPPSEWDAIFIDTSAACGKCNVVPGPGLRLWGEASEHLLLGNLKNNIVETETLLALFTSSGCGADIVVLEIHDLKTPAFATWKKEERLCSACLDKLVAAHLHLWLFKRKVLNGWTPTEDCWYGYNCRTQTHKREHAKNKNHLCAPTR
ncbi:hypothetical protein B0H11DRAFT_2435097 [Mycena galericulata]|nr:hypothetical protein B0H11DRAFT_2435097 [Mycena galericulata]